VGAVAEQIALDQDFRHLAGHLVVQSRGTE
jgi:hypothetical protein